MGMKSGLIAAALLGAGLAGCASTGGVAELDCGVAPSGLLSDCRVLSESPSGEGIGQAAVRSANGTHVSAETMRTPPATGRINFVVRDVKPGA